MKDKEKQIEEMARTIGGCHTTPNCKTCDEKSGSPSCYNKTGAKNLYNAGYRKIDKDKEVVLTKEEYEIFTDIKSLQLQVQDSLNNMTNEDIANITKQARIETAEKFIGLRKYITQQFHNYHEARDKAEAEYKKCKEEIGKAVLNNDWHRADAIMFILEDIATAFDEIAKQYEVELET